MPSYAGASPTEMGALDVSVLRSSLEETGCVRTFMSMAPLCETPRTWKKLDGVGQVELLGLGEVSKRCMAEFIRLSYFFHKYHF